MKRKTSSEEDERKKRVRRNPKRCLLKEWDWRRLKGELEQLGCEAKYEPSAKHKENPARYGLAVVFPGETQCMRCDSNGRFTDLDLIGELLQKAFAFGLVDDRFNKKWPLHIWGLWNDMVFEAHWGNNGTYHGYPLQKNDPMWEEIMKACDARKYS